MTGRTGPLLWGGLGAVLVLVVALGAWDLVRAPVSAGPEAAAGSLESDSDYGEVPWFDLVDRSGRRVTRDDLLGRWWVADFIFTRCTGVCPVLTARMSSLSAALARMPEAGEVRLVSFTVDPSHDTPDVLSRYAAAAGGEARAPGRWLFLTGPVEQLHRLIGEGFRLSVAARAPEASSTTDSELITHSDRFVLVDPRGRIRGYYHGQDEEAIRRLASEIQRRL